MLLVQPSSFLIFLCSIFISKLFLLCESSYKLLGIGNSHLDFPKCQRGSSDDDGKSNPVSGAYKIPKICGNLVVGHSFTLRSSSLVDAEICVAEYNNLCDVRYDGAQIEPNDFVRQSSCRYGHTCSSFIRWFF